MHETELKSNCMALFVFNTRVELISYHVKVTELLKCILNFHV